MKKTRVLIVDDSSAVTRAIKTALSAEPDMVIVGTARNGLLALGRLSLGDVDAVILDLEMPVMGGLETVSRIRAKWPELPVVIFSAHTERGAADSLEALSRGATDYVPKPTVRESVAGAVEYLRAELGGKIRAAVCRPSVTPGAMPSAHPAEPVVIRKDARRVRPNVVAVASSTGGPNALVKLFSHLPAGLGVPILVVQHMPPIFTRALAERLDKLSPFPVREAVDGEPVVPGEALIAPGGKHMEVARAPAGVFVRLHEGPPVLSCRPAADVLFHSIAKVYGAATLGVVLTGMGQDGLEGSRSLVGAGGRVITQDEASSVVWGMPGFVTRAGLASAVRPIDEVPMEVVRSLRATPGGLSVDHAS